MVVMRLKTGNLNSELKFLIPLSISLKDLNVESFSWVKMSSVDVFIRTRSWRSPMFNHRRMLSRCSCIKILKNLNNCLEAQYQLPPFPQFQHLQIPGNTSSRQSRARYQIVIIYICSYFCSLCSFNCFFFIIAYSLIGKHSHGYINCT